MFFFDEHLPFHDTQPVEHGKPGTNRQFLVKGHFPSGGGGVIGHSKFLLERGVFRKFICKHQQEKRRRGML